MEEIVTWKYQMLKPEWNEWQRRLWAAGEAFYLGRGGVSIVARATGLSRPTITKGIKEHAALAIKRVFIERVLREGRILAIVLDHD